MNPSIKLSIPSSRIWLILSLACIIGFLPNVQAVSPPPDGGYPGANTAEGENALLSLTTGAANTAVGYFSLTALTTGSFNTGLGAWALFNNTSNENTAIGAGALFSNTTGSSNTANGFFALLLNTTGFNNTANGGGALQNNTFGFSNTASGAGALFRNTIGTSNTAAGFNVLSANTTGNGNTASGDSSLAGNTTGNGNTATGFEALLGNTTGSDNTAIGSGTLLQANASNNTAIGSATLVNNITGSNNTSIGFRALFNNTTGGSNTVLGFNTGGAVTTANNVICIGAGVAGGNVSNTCYIGSIFGQTSSGGSAVFINANGKLGTSTSSQRFKDDIKPMDKASEALFALKPVSFRYKKEIDPTGASQLGLVAEDVEKVNPDLVVRDKEGKPYSVRYDQVNAMLLNEFLKEHRKVEELEANAARQQKQIEELTAGLQKLSAEPEGSKSATQVADIATHFTASTARR